MNKKALTDSLAARPTRRRGRAEAPAAERPAPAPATPAAAPVRKVRLNVDLVGTEARDFERWRVAAADQLNRSRVTTQDVGRLLIRRLLDDETLAAAIVAELANEQGGQVTP